MNLNSRLAGHKLGKPNLYETAIQANKNRFAELVCVRFYFTTKWRGFSREKQKSTPTCRSGQFQTSPQKNRWVLLRKTIEKAARSGDNFRVGSDLVRFYDQVRTDFEEMGWNQPRRLRVQARAAPRQKIRPLNYLMNFPRRSFNFLAERAGFSGGSPTASGVGAVAKAATGRHMSLKRHV